MAYDVDLADRIRELLGTAPTITEQRMFGGLAFMVKGNMAVAASGQGGLMVRVDPSESARLVKSTTATPMIMKGRPMAGWLRVPTKDVRTKPQLRKWVTIGTTYAGSLPAQAASRCSPTQRLMPTTHPTRHLLRAKDLADARYAEPLTVADLARAARLSPAHFSREFRAAFGESPHRYLLTRRLERAAALLRTTDWSVARIVHGGRAHQHRVVHDELPADVRRPAAGLPRRLHPDPAAHAIVPACVVRFYGRPQHRTFREDTLDRRSVGSTSPTEPLRTPTGGTP